MSFFVILISKCRCDAHHECLTVFCSTCDHAICHKCALFDGRHGDHNFRPLDEVYKEHLEVVKNEMGILSDRRREIQALLKEIVGFILLVLFLLLIVG